MILTLREEWMDPAYTPASLYESPFRELDCTPTFGDVIEARHSPETAESLEAFAAGLVGNLERQLRRLEGPVHVLISGGYDSRILTFLLERMGLEPLCVTAGTEEPGCSQAMDIIGIPAERRYVHDMSGPDPYGLADATCRGFAQLYQQFRFMPGDPAATLVTGLGGGEWFSYPASGWLRGKERRLPGDDLVAMWLDCWPQYTLIPEAWARGYADALHPYCTVEYAAAAARCRSEWVRETPDNPALDLVRQAMLVHLDERLLEPGWAPHVYEWGLTEEQRDKIDERYLSSPIAGVFHQDEWGLPSAMDAADHACRLAGFATWCEELEMSGYEVRLP
jgi:hypothetical protein